MNPLIYTKLYQWMELGGVAEFLSSREGGVYGLNGFLYVWTPRKLLSELTARLKIRIQDEDILKAIAGGETSQLSPPKEDSNSELDAVCQWLQECQVDKYHLWPDNADMECVSRSISAFCSLCSGPDGHRVLLSSVAYLNICLELDNIHLTSQKLRQSLTDLAIKYNDGVDAGVSSAVSELGNRVSSLDVYAVVRVLRSGVLDAYTPQQSCSGRSSTSDNFMSRFSSVVNGFIQRGSVSSQMVTEVIGRPKQYIGVYNVKTVSRQITIITPPTFAKKAVKLHFLNALIDSGFIMRPPSSFESKRVQRSGYLAIIYIIYEAMLSIIVGIFSPLTKFVRRRPYYD